MPESCTRTCRHPFLSHLHTATTLQSRFAPPLGETQVSPSRKFSLPSSILPLLIQFAPIPPTVGRGAFTFTAGAWNIVTQRVRLNDVGQANGIMELYLNGVKKIDLSGLTLRLSSDVIFRGIMAQTFFGGECGSLVRNVKRMIKLNMHICLQVRVLLTPLLKTNMPTLRTSR